MANSKPIVVVTLIDKEITDENLLALIDLSGLVHGRNSQRYALRPRLLVSSEKVDSTTQQLSALYERQSEAAQRGWIMVNVESKDTTAYTAETLKSASASLREVRAEAKAARSA